MLEPHDGERVASREGPIAFYGAVPWAAAASQTLYLWIEARNWKTGRFEPVTWPFSADGPVYTLPSGRQVALWDTSIPLPPTYWQPGVTGFRAEVRTGYLWQSLEGFVQSVEADYWSCLGENGFELAAFRRHCRAAVDPVARIYTADFCGPSTSTETGFGDSCPGRIPPAGGDDVEGEYRSGGGSAQP
jgi:hypothetical protein